MISAPNRAAAATFSGLPDAWTTGLPLAYLQFLQLRKVARTTTADPRYTYLYINLGDPSTAVQWLAACGHNLTPGSGKVRWRRLGAINPAGIVNADFLRTAALPAGWALTRTGDATYFGSNGLLQTAATNVARFQYVGGALKGLLLEDASTNTLKYSRDLSSSNGQWAIFGCVPQKLATGIDGVANAATKVTSVSSSASLLQTVTAGQTAVLSAYIRAPGGSGTVELVIGATVQACVLTSAYQRFQVAGVTGVQVGIRWPSGGGLPAVDIDAVQLEVGRANATSPIHTTSAAATRNADVLAYAGVNALGATYAAGSLLVEGELTARPPATGAIAAVGASLTATNRVGLELSAAGIVEGVSVSSGAGSVSGVVGNAVAVGSQFTAALAWTGSATFRGAFDGAAALTDASVVAPLGAASDLVLGGGCYHLRAVRLYDGAVSATQLQSLSDHSELELAADYDSGEIDACPSAWVAATTAEQRATLRKHAAHKCPTEMTGGYWRLDLIEPTHPQGYLQLGRVFMGPIWQPPTNVGYGDISMRFVDRDLVSETASGAEYGVKQQSPREMRITFSWLDDADLDALLYIDALVGTSEEIYVAREPDDESRLPLWSFIARFLELSDTEEPGYGEGRKTCVARERL